jgi:hypothetical protein
VKKWDRKGRRNGRRKRRSKVEGTEKKKEKEKKREKKWNKKGRRKGRRQGRKQRDGQRDGNQIGRPGKRLETFGAVPAETRSMAQTSRSHFLHPSPKQSDGDGTQVHRTGQTVMVCR